MKIFVAFLFLFFSLWAVPVDTKLYEGDNTLAYYEQLSKKLSEYTPIDEEDAERLQNEKALLEKLKTLIIKGPLIQTFDTTLLGKETIKDSELMKLFGALASSVEQKEKLLTMQSFIQEKLSYLKKTIENIIDLQHKNLRLYQLQFAYYKLQHHHDDVAIGNLSLFIQQGEKTLSLLSERVMFDIKVYQINDTKLQQEIEKINKKLIAVNLSKERELLLQEKISLKLSQKLDKLTKEKDDALLAQAEKKLTAGLYYFQTKNIHEILRIDKEIREILKQLSYKDTLLKAKLTTLRSITKESQDAINYNVMTIKESLLSSYDKFLEYIQKPFIVIDETPISFLSIFKVIGILIAGFIVAKIYFRLFMMLHKKRKVTKAVSIKIIANTGSTLILFVASVIALGSIGLSIAHLAVIAGALSIGAGFALRGIVSSVLSGMVLLGENYIKIGDYITVNKLTGKVMDIGFRATVIKTIDNIDIIVPNSDLIEGQVINLTFEDRIRRIYVPFKVPYGSNVKEISAMVVKAVMEATKIKLLRDYPRKKPTIWMAGVGESYIELELLVWIEGLRPSTKSALLILIYDTLRANGVAMPLPQMDVNINERKQTKRLASANMAKRIKVS